MAARVVQNYAPAGGQMAVVNNSGAGRFGFGYGNQAGSPVARAPVVQYQQPAVQYQQPAVQYQQAGAVQYVQPGTTYGQAPAPPQFLSPSGMAKLKEFTTDHHWRQRSKQLSPLFDEAGNGARGLNYQQLQKFYDLAGMEFFGEPVSKILTPDIFERFDFNGDGMLEFIQAFKSLKCVLYEGFHESGLEMHKPVELSTPEEKGYTMIKELARGGQGAAILASHPERGQVVLKTYEKNNPNAGTLEEHIAEMDVLKELSEEDYVMHAYDIFQDKDCVYCVNELMSGGDLEGLREKTGKAGIPLTQEYFRNIFKQTLLGLDHIHTHGLMHCDLKEPNVMIKNTDFKNPQVAIIDFGLASVCAGPGEAGGTPGYVPPETNTTHIWYPKGDIFALGVTFFQLLADKTPSEKIGKLGVFQEGFTTLDDVVRFTATRPLPWHLVQGKYPGVMAWLPDMCNKQKKPRPRALQLLDKPFFNDENGASSEPVTNARIVPNFSNQSAAPQDSLSRTVPAKLLSQTTRSVGAVAASPYQAVSNGARIVSSVSIPANGLAGAYASPQISQPQQVAYSNQPQMARVLNQGPPVSVRSGTVQQMQAQPVQMQGLASYGGFQQPVQMQAQPVQMQASYGGFQQPVQMQAQPVQMQAVAANGAMAPRVIMSQAI